MDQFRAEIQKEDADHIKRKLSEDGYNLSRGYGGKFGVETDRMDKSAMGHDYQVLLQFDTGPVLKWECVEPFFRPIMLRF